MARVSLANTDPRSARGQVLNEKGQPGSRADRQLPRRFRRRSVLRRYESSPTPTESRRVVDVGASGTQRVEFGQSIRTTGGEAVSLRRSMRLLPRPPPLITPDAYEPNEGAARPHASLRIWYGESRSLSANFHTLIDVDCSVTPACSTGTTRAAALSSLDEDFYVHDDPLNVPVGSTILFHYRWRDAARLAYRTWWQQRSFTLLLFGKCTSDNSTNLDLKVERGTGDPSATMYSLSSSVTEQ